MENFQQNPPSINSDSFRDFFEDLSRRQESEILANKIRTVRDELNPPPIQISSFSFTKLNTSPDQIVQAKANAKMNYQFFVWRNGEAGRLSVDTPFGYKPI